MRRFCFILDSQIGPCYFVYLILLRGSATLKGSANSLPEVLTVCNSLEAELVRQGPGLQVLQHQ